MKHNGRRLMMGPARFYVIPIIVINCQQLSFMIMITFTYFHDDYESFYYVCFAAVGGGVVVVIVVGWVVGVVQRLLTTNASDYACHLQYKAQTDLVPA